MMRALKWSNVRAGIGTGYASVDGLEVGERVRGLERGGHRFQLRPRPRQAQPFIYAPLLGELPRSPLSQ